MTDLSKLSDADLQALYGKTGAVKPASEMSDAELLAAHQSPRGIIDKLTGRDGGERYQTWPEKLVRGVASSVSSAATLPGDVAQGKQAVDPADPAFMGRALDFAGAATPVNPAIRAGDRAVPGIMRATRPEKPVVPTTAELAKAGGADIQAARASGLDVSSLSVANYSKKLQQELFDSGVHPVDAPSTFTKLKALEDAPPDSFFTAANLQSLRESLQATAQNFNPQAAKDQLAASRAIKGFDQFLPTIDAKDVLAGSPAATSQLFERGRGNYAAAMRSNDLNGSLDRANTGILERAEARAQAANSGRNLDNTIRSKIVSLLEKPKEVSGFSDPEIAALNASAEGGAGRNTARYIGNLLGGGGGLGQSAITAIGASTGGVMGGIPGAVVGGVLPSAIGAGSKSIANALAKRSLNKTDELLRTRSPLYQERVANPEMSVISPEKRAAIARALLLQALQGQQEGSANY